MKIRITLLFIAIMLLSVTLRFYNLGQVPISLHGDEVGVGFNAYSLLISGIDEYGRSWPLTFRADVAPIIFYATIPAIALFGNTEFAVRLPSMIIGTLTTAIFYFLVKELSLSVGFNHNKNHPKMWHIMTQKRETTALLATLLLVISPWHVQISRIAHDASYGLFLQILAAVYFLRFIRLKKINFWYISIVLFGLTYYAYHGPRLTTPLLLILLVWIFKRCLNFRQVVLGGSIFLLITLPIINDFFSRPFAETRIGGINIFIREESDKRTTTSIPLKLISNFLNQYNPRHLFLDTSPTRYFNVQSVGLLYLANLPFLLIGLFYLVSIKSWRLFVLSVIIISVLPGALTLGPPNAGRILLLMPIMEFITAFGVIIFTRERSGFYVKKRIRIYLIILIFAFNVSFFLYQYLIDSPNRFKEQWQYGVKEIMEFAVNSESNFDKIIVDSNIKQAYVYMLFYGQKTLDWINTAVNKKRNKFVGYDSIEKYEFRQINWEEDRGLINALLITPSSKIPKESGIYVVLSQTGQPIYKAVTSHL